MAELYYSDDRIQLYHGRCEDVLPTLAAGSVDLVLTDPPYGTTALEWDKAPDLAWLWGELGRACKPSAVQAVFSAQPFTTDLIMSNRSSYRYELIWPKVQITRFLDANRRPLQSHENVQIFAREMGRTTYNPQKTTGKAYGIKHRESSSSHYGSHVRTSTTNHGDRHPTTILPAYSSGRRDDHPTQKPLELLCWLIATYSNPGDLVLDPYGGRGTTAWAAKKLGRRCIIIEGQERYCEIAARGLAQEVMNLAEVAA